MQRRDFVKPALAASGSAFTPEPPTPEPQTTEPQTTAPQTSQQFYQLRAYSLRSGPQLALAETFFEQALIPALNRLHLSPVGAFRLDIGPQTPTFYVLIPATSPETLASLETHLEADPEYVKAASGFRDAPASAPAFLRAEQTLLAAFSGWPTLTAPKTVPSGNTKRIFQLRTYESPSQAAHQHKVQMFNEGEIGIFTRAGLSPVFFAQTLIGTRTPSLTYMLTFPNVAELTRAWSAFGADPAWKELSRRPGNTDPEIVSNISNLYLSPLTCSQI